MRARGWWSCVPVIFALMLGACSAGDGGGDEATTTQLTGGAVDLAVSPEGEAVLAELATEIAAAGESARLVLSVGGSPVSAAAVPEPLEDLGTVRIGLPEGLNAADVVELIRTN
ncbi:hypothetical protein EXU48_06205 [Occultella glacieicola]|uniref:Uncharacterized protein n=1 Tax=Occultella glacieicola TaxID=2518684 RepID=A0ABY2E9A1_9MICO|nr:hypothetical protein [Occultella glacieicola]TDE95850.1 hypothetical protein EXU48_06205 [Occultella glacieicola]